MNGNGKKNWSSVGTYVKSSMCKRERKKKELEELNLGIMLHL